MAKKSKTAKTPVTVPVSKIKELIADSEKISKKLAKSQEQLGKMKLGGSCADIMASLEEMMSYDIELGVRYDFMLALSEIIAVAEAEAAK